MRYIECFRINEKITVECDPSQELLREKQAAKLWFRRLTKPIKALTQTCLKSAIRFQVGAWIGNVGALAFPAIAITSALLIASILAYVCLIAPGANCLPTFVLGLTLGVLHG